MNAQTPGPITIRSTPGGEELLDQHDCTVALVPRYGSAIVPAGYVAPWHRAQSNADLLGAAYLAFDRAGRELGVDATEFAKSLDLVGLIRGAIRTVAHPGSDGARDALDQALRTMPPFGPLE